MRENLLSKALVPALLLSAALAGCSSEEAPPAEQAAPGGAPAAATETPPAPAAATPAQQATSATPAAGGAVDMSGSFDGWRQIGDANWTIENGEFVATMGAGHLVTQDSFTDFRISLEFFVDSGTANSGVFFRASNPDQIVDTNAYEANIFDERPDQSGRTGGIVHFGAPSQAINTAGQWNTYEITAQGDHLVVVLNGVTTVDIRDATYASGPISLQYGAGEVRFRNVMIERL